MGKFQAMHKYFAVFLALVAFHDSLLTHGRHIKPSKQHSSLKTDISGQEDNPQPTIPHLKSSVNVPPPSSEKKVDSPMIPKYDVASFGDSGAVYTNAFRHTTPGSSPGVGHRKFAVEDKDMKAMVVVQNPDVKASVTEGFRNDFRPTNPGHSPGVGHAHQNKNGQDKDMKAMVVVQSSDVKASVTEGFKNDFRPTNPGHSPGVGHAHQNKNGQLN